MDAIYYQRLHTVFNDAAELPEAERQRFLHAACGDDKQLLADALAMLAQDARSGDFLVDRSVGDVAADLMALSEPAGTAPKKFGPYRITRPLGQGGMGVVYLAKRDDLGSLAAIKFLRNAWLSPSLRERFAREQRILAQFNHPSIARLYDANTLEDGTPFFIMEYVEGLKLNEYCTRRECSIDERLNLFRAVCAAVQYAHRHAVIHCDLKPSNILVKEDGTIRLLDFGIARELRAMEVPLGETRTLVRFMTQAYAAPEQMRNEALGVHTDVYSLGVILYELLSGRLPFDLSELTPREAETIVMEVEPLRPSAVTTHRFGESARQRPSRAMWNDLDLLCLTALHKDPARRYSTVEALGRDIDHYLRGEPLEARPDSVTYRLDKFVRRNRRAVSAATAVVAGGAGLIAFFTMRLARARNAAVAEAARTERIQRFTMNLFQGGDDAAGPPEDLRVLTLIDRGLREAEALSDDPAIQAEIHQTLGDIYQELGRLEQAEEVLTRALNRRLSLFGPQHPDVAESMLALADLRIDQTRLEDAEKLTRQALEICKRQLPANHPQLAKAVFTLGKLLQQRGDYQRSAVVLEEAVRLRSRPGIPAADLGQCFGELANTRFYLGQYEESQSLNRRALEIDRQVHGDSHPNVAFDLINLGGIEQEWGRFSEAEAYYRKGLEIMEAWYGPDHRRVAAAMTVLVRALTPQGRYEESAALLRRVLPIQEKIFGKKHWRTAGAVNEMGLVALFQGRLDEAESLFAQAAEMYSTANGEQSYLPAVPVVNTARVHLAREDYAKAEELFRSALRRFAATLPPTHLRAAAAHVGLGRALLRQGRYAEAHEHTVAGYEGLRQEKGARPDLQEMAREDLATLREVMK